MDGWVSLVKVRRDAGTDSLYSFLLVLLIGVVEFGGGIASGLAVVKGGVGGINEVKLARDQDAALPSVTPELLEEGVTSGGGVMAWRS